MISRNAIGLSALAAAALLAVCAATASAGKKPPPPAPGPVDTGTILFTRLGITWSMNPDGSGKTAFPAPFGTLSDAEPSRHLHGGHRWFLKRLQIPGETYNGFAPRRELFAVRDDGAVTTQLTFQPDLSPSEYTRWSPDDTKISWPASRWVGGAIGPMMVYVADVVFDGTGAVAGIGSQPQAPAVAVPSLSTHDWSPDGLRLVLENNSPGELWIADLVSGTASRLVTSLPARCPVWSPDGTRIAYTYSVNGTVGLRTIAPSGGSETTVVAAQTGVIATLPAWSPNGINLAFRRSTGSSRCDVYRVGAPGSTPVNLTAELNTGIPNTANLKGWR